jgi:hypothetical protein
VVLTSLPESETLALRKSDLKTTESPEIKFCGTAEGNSSLDNISNHDIAVFRIYKST